MRTPKPALWFGHAVLALCTLLVVTSAAVLSSAGTAAAATSRAASSQPPPVPANAVPLPASGPSPIPGQSPDPNRKHVPPSSGPHSSVVPASHEYDSASVNWSGQAVMGTIFNSVSGYWTVPAVVPSLYPQYMSDWIGIGGMTTLQLIQTGTVSQTAGGSNSYQAWYEMLPAPPVNIPMAVAPGDLMRASINEIATDVWQIQIQDATRGWTAAGTFFYNAGTAASAEWITERPLVTGFVSTLANYGSSEFSSLGYFAASPTSVHRTSIYMANTTGMVISYPTKLSAATGGSFVDVFGAPKPTVTSVSPPKGSPAGGTEVTIEGTYLVPGLVTTVFFGTVPAPGTIYPTGKIVVQSPAETAGTVDVVITTTYGDTTPTVADRFTYADPTAPPPTAGYHEVASDGGMFTFGNAAFHGSMGGHPLNAPIVGMAVDSQTGGYWEVASDGGIFAFDAPFFGSMGGRPLNAPIVGMAATPTGGGYWEVASDGGIFAFGDAAFHGSMGGKTLSQPIVDIAVDPHTGGYWEVASDGGIFAFDAPFFGSMGGHPLNRPIVGMATTKTGQGYWEIASDGGIFSYGDAVFYGSMGGHPLNKPIVAIAAAPTGQGYWEVASDGGIFAFGIAQFYGSMGGYRLNRPIVGAAAT